MSATITLDGARWSEEPHDFEQGTAGSSYRNFYFTVGPDDYVWFSHEADGSTGLVQTGPDPGDTVAGLSGMTGHEVELVQGNNSAEDVMDLLDTVLTGITGVTSATPEVSANADGTWSMDVDTDLEIASGTVSWASQGGRGMHGGHVCRIPTNGQAAGWLDIEITRPVANRITAPDSDAIIWAVQLMMGDTVGANRPRLQYIMSGSTTTPDSTPEMIADFGQLPSAQLTAGRAATIFLTATQINDLRTDIDAASGSNHWISAHCTSGTNYAGMAVATGYEGEAVDQNVRVDNTQSNDPTSAITDWDSSGETNFGFILGARLIYDIDPCTTGEHQTTWGSFTPFATHPDTFTLPDARLGQRGGVDGLEGARIVSGNIGIDSGTFRVGVGTGGTQDVDSPDVDGATMLWESTGTGVGDTGFTLPTGDDVVRVPDSGGLWIFWKGEGQDGTGETINTSTYDATGEPDMPDTFIRRDDAGGNRNENPGEREFQTTTDDGDPNDDFEDPCDPGTGVVVAQFSPNNKPYLRLLLTSVAAVVTNEWLIATTTAGTSTVTGTLDGAGALDGSSAGVGADIASLTGVGDLAAASAGLATTLATMIAIAAIATNTPGTSTVTGTLDGAGAITATSAGAATDAATLTGVGALATTTAGAATSTGTLSSPGDLTATVTGTSTVTGTVTGVGDLASTTPGTSTVTGTLAVSDALNGTTAGTSTVAGTLTGAAPLAASVISGATSTGTLTGVGDLASTTPGTSTATATIDFVSGIAATTGGSSTASGTILGAGVLVASSAGTSTANATAAVPVATTTPLAVRVPPTSVTIIRVTPV